MKHFPLLPQMRRPPGRPLGLTRTAVSPCRTSRTLAALLLLASGLTVPVWAADIRTLQVDEDQGRYTATLDAVVDADRDKVYAMITKPERWPEFSHVITDAHVTGKLPDGRRVVSVTFQDCILIFCQTIHKQEALRTSASGDIETHVIPEQSDFSYAHEHWQVSEEGRRTRIRYHAEMTPDFYIPPLIGTYLLKEKIRSLLLHVIASLEAQATP